MSDTIPHSALERAAELANKEANHITFTADYMGSFFIGKAFARYIAEHEDPPADVLVAALLGLVPCVPEPAQGENYAEAFARELRKELAVHGLKIVEAEQ